MIFGSELLAWVDRRSSLRVRVMVYEGEVTLVEVRYRILLL